MKKLLIVLGLLGILFAIGVFLLSTIDAFREGARSANERPSVTLEDEESLRGDMLTYASGRYGVAFSYPKKYFLRENERDAPSGPESSTVLIEDTKENRDLVDGTATEPREGPTSITIDVYLNLGRLSAHAFAAQTGNWAVSDGQLSAASVGGIPGVSYLFDGLYAGKAVVVTNGEYAYVFSVTWITSDDAITEDYNALLRSVTFDIPEVS